MKKYIGLLLLFFPGFLFAQVENKPIDFNPPGQSDKKSSAKINAYLGINGSLNNSFDQPYGYLGLSAAFFVDKNIPIGITYNFHTVNQLTTISPPPGIQSVYVNTAYMGVFSGYRFYPEEPVGFSIMGTVGAGGLNYTFHDYTGRVSYNRIDGYFMFIPELSLDLRPFQFLEFSIGVKYLFFTGNEKDLGITAGNMSGFSPFIGIKFNPFRL
jgi:hypothetical protein